MLDTSAMIDCHPNVPTLYHRGSPPLEAPSDGLRVIHSMIMVISPFFLDANFRETETEKAGFVQEIMLFTQLSARLKGAHGWDIWLHSLPLPPLSGSFGPALSAGRSLQAPILTALFRQRDCEFGNLNSDLRRSIGTGLVTVATGFEGSNNMELFLFE